MTRSGSESAEVSQGPRGFSARRALARWRAELRQRSHHRPFRIAEPVWDAGERARLRRLVDDLAVVTSADAAGAADGGDQAAGPDAAALDEKALAEAATYLWRARKKLAREGTGSREARQLRRLLNSSQEALDSAGVIVQDHDGGRFDSGRSLEVLAFEADPGLTVETVQETVRPSVYLGDRRIQMGQVIVGRPAGAASDGTTEAGSA